MYRNQLKFILMVPILAAITVLSFAGLYIGSFVFILEKMKKHSERIDPAMGFILIPIYIAFAFVLLVIYALLFPHSF